MAKLNLKALCKVLVNNAAHGNRGSGPPWRPGYASAERILNRKQSAHVWNPSIRPMNAASAVDMGCSRCTSPQAGQLSLSCTVSFLLWVSGHAALRRSGMPADSPGWVRSSV